MPNEWIENGLSSDTVACGDTDCGEVACGDPVPCFNGLANLSAWTQTSLDP
jgi:hypothetical protein